MYENQNLQLTYIWNNKSTSSLTFNTLIRLMLITCMNSDWMILYSHPKLKYTWKSGRLERVSKTTSSNVCFKMFTFAYRKRIKDIIKVTNK